MPRAFAHLAALAVAAALAIAAPAPAQTTVPCMIQSSRLTMPNLDIRGAVAISGDGQTIAYANPGDNRVRVFVKTGAGWVAQGPALAPAPISAFNDPAIALSGDGNTLLLGLPAQNAAFVFKRSGGIWSQQAVLTPTGAVGANPLFGFSVGLHLYGNLAVVGSPNDNANTGAVFTFQQSGNSWSQVNKLSGFAPSSLFGWPLFLSFDGATLFTAASADTHRFTRSGAGWSHTGSSPMGFTTKTVSADGTMLFGTVNNGTGIQYRTYGPTFAGGFPAFVGEYYHPVGAAPGTSVVAANSDGRFLAGSTNTGLTSGIVIIDRANPAKPLQGFSSSTTALPMANQPMAMDFDGNTVVAIAPDGLPVFTIRTSTAFYMNPSSATAAAGGSVVFPSIVGLDHGIGVTLHWLRNGVPNSDGLLPSGTVASLSSTEGLVLTNLTLAESGSVFQCVATTACGDMVSTPASLIVTPRCRADVASPGGAPTPDGTVTVDDLIRYLSDFFSACP